MTKAPRPVLHVRAGTQPPQAVALVLHGGQATGTDPVPPWSRAYLRMYPFARALRRAGGHQGLAVAMLRYAVEGWNGELRSPVADARWALARLRERFGDVDVALIGHSMGGRTAFVVADVAAVRVVVALAPWIEPIDAIEPVAGRTLLIVHGTLDRVTDPEASADFAQRSRSIAKQVTFAAIDHDGHAMLRRAGLWHDLAAGFTVESLLNHRPAYPVRTLAAEAIRAALTGTPSIEI